MRALWGRDHRRTRGRARVGTLRLCRVPTTAATFADFYVGQGRGVVKEREIKAVKDYAVSGYAHAHVTIKPWTVYVDRTRLVDKGGRPRRFSTEAAAMTAARRAIT